MTARLHAFPSAPTSSTTTSTKNAPSFGVPATASFNDSNSPRGIDIPAPNVGAKTGAVQFRGAPLTPSPSPTNLLRDSALSTNAGRSTVSFGGPVALVGVNAPSVINSAGAFAPTPPSTPPSGTLGAAHPQASSDGISPLLAQLFPANYREIAPYSRSVSVESYQPDGSTIQWDGFVLETPPSPVARPSRSTSNTMPVRSSSSNSFSSISSSSSSSSSSPTSPTRSAFKGARAAQQAALIAAAAVRNAASNEKKKTLYMSAQGAFKQYDRVRETIVALLDLASEHLECEALVIVLDRGMAGAGAKTVGPDMIGRSGAAGAGGQSAEFGELLHSLMYVGGSIVSRPPGAASLPVDPRYLLVGIEV